MSFRCQQNLFHYLNDNSAYTPSFIRSSPHTILPHHQEQHLQMSPGKFSLPQASPSLELNTSRAASGIEQTSHQFGGNEGGDDNQPLDLSIHPNRSEQALSLALSNEHKPLCMVKSCTCHTSSPQSHHLPRYSTTEQTVTRSPNPGITMSSSTVQNHTSESAYNSCSSSAAAFPRHIPQPSPWPAAHRSSFQQLTTSDSALNGCHGTSSLFRPYDDPIDQNTNIHLHRQQHVSTLKRHIDVAGEEDEPTYMDLDSSPFSAGSRNKYTGHSSHMHGKPNVPQTSSTQNRTQVWLEALPSQYESALTQAHQMGGNFASSEVKSAACHVGGVISHTSLEKSQKVRSPPTSGSPNSEGGTSHNVYPQNQIYSSHSSSPFDNGSLPAGPNGTISAGTPYHGLQQSHSPATFYPSTSTFGHPNPTDGFVYSKPQSPHTKCQREQTDSESLLDTSYTSECESNISRSSPSSGTNSFHMPALRRYPGEVIGSQDRPTDEPMNITCQQQAACESAVHENSTKISLLDFWISKILMERSSEAPAARKPCNVDYICTANGERKIRLRLVDLMELQVEQSLKA